MSEPSYDHHYWEGLWTKTLSRRRGKAIGHGPNPHLLEVAGSLPPGAALDAGCGHGAESRWLAARGWEVTAVDFSAAALAHARSTAEAAGAAVAERIEWVEADLAAWTPEAERYELVISLYVHLAGSVEAMVRRLAAAVAPGGNLLLVGHGSRDPATGAATRAAGQTQVSVDAARAALDPDRWQLLVAEDRARAVVGSGADQLIHARRR